MKTSPAGKLAMGGEHLKVPSHCSFRCTHAGSLPSRTLTQRGREPDKGRDIFTQPLQYFSIICFADCFRIYSLIEHCSCLQSLLQMPVPLLTRMPAISPTTHP
ncbi:hypothetical protein M405DRAFT_807613 [Rhizopogon salebrosus TDB-379]|nr:hypothetical protein M405DRAFT_807613 [Rhizopogon salebrosus TDB-379]